MSFSKISFLGSVSFLFGLILGFLEKGFFLGWFHFFWAGFLILFVSGLKEKKFSYYGICLIGLSLGLWRGNLAETDLIKKKILMESIYNQSVVLTGQVIKEPEKSFSFQKLIVFSQNYGKILVKTSFYPDYEYGDYLQIKGILKKPDSFGNFDYQNYLERKGIFVLMKYPKIERLDKNYFCQSGRFFCLLGLVYKDILRLKTRLRESLTRNLPWLHQTILRAMILGDKSNLPSSLKEKLNQSGTRHIVAISGLHMVVFSQILVYLGLAVGLWRQQVFWFVSLFLVFYIIFIGLPISACRAGLVAFLLLLAEKVGRVASVGRALILVAFLMLLLNPFLLLEPGFQLSFAAAWGIFSFRSFFEKILKWIPNFFQIRNMLIMTFSAQLATWPILLYHFGQFSWRAPIANLLIIPCLSWLLGSGFLLGLIGLFSQTLAHFLAWPVILLLGYVLKVIEWMG